MAREQTVARVRETIRTAFSGGGQPTNEELIADAGVSSATFYRVLRQHEDVALLLDSGRFGQAIAAEAGSTTSDDDLTQVIAELREVVAALVEQNRELRDQLEHRRAAGDDLPAR